MRNIKAKTVFDLFSKHHNYVSSLEITGSFLQLFGVIITNTNQ